MLVEVWSDVVCPWCYIGKRRFEEAQRRLAEDPDFDDDIELVYRPYQLDPRATPGTAMPVAEAYARKFGGPEAAARIMDQMTAVAAGEGLEFHLERARRANTRDAHRLLGWALEHGPAGAQAALKERLLRAYFVEGEDVGDPDVLVAAAVEAGLPDDGARRMLEDGTGTDELTEAAAVRGRERDHGRADVRHRPPLVDPRRPGPGHVRPGDQAAGGDGRATSEPANMTASDERARQP